MINIKLQILQYLHLIFDKLKINMPDNIYCFHKKSSINVFYHKAKKLNIELRFDDICDKFSLSINDEEFMLDITTIHHMSKILENTNKNYMELINIYGAKVKINIQSCRSILINMLNDISLISNIQYYSGV